MKTILAVLLIAAAAAAQEKPPATEKVSKTFEVKRGNAERIANALNSLGASVGWSRDANLMVVKADKDLMPALEQVVQRLDVAAPTEHNIELTVYLVQASQSAGQDTPIPPDVQPVIKQLRGIFAYQSYRLLDTLLLRSREGQEATTSGLLASGAQPPLPDTSAYSFRFRPSVRGEGKDRTIRIDRLYFTFQVPLSSQGGGFRFQDATINAEVDLKEGQKVVVGKTSTYGAERALILVLSGKVVD